MFSSALRERISNKCRRALVDTFARQMFPLPRDRAYISFTFDDFPRSAYTEGGRILRQHGVRGTYYIAMQLLGRDTVVGKIACADDLTAVVADGHEIGCHTFGHLDGARVSVDEYTRSFEANQEAYERIVPGGRLRTFSYPFDGPRLAVKRVMAGRFLCCRGSGQTFNHDTVDLALVKSYFIDQRDGHDTARIADVIKRNSIAKGWLVFSTHDVTDRSTRFGCSPALFDDVVRLACESGARVLPVADVCDELGVRN